MAVKPLAPGPQRASGSVSLWRRRGTVITSASVRTQNRSDGSERTNDRNLAAIDEVDIRPLVNRAGQSWRANPRIEVEYARVLRMRDNHEGLSAVD
jgi:hypothetical protein